MTSLSTPSAVDHRDTTDKRTVTTTTATAIAIADMIGIGVFTSLGFQVGDIPSGFALLLLWVVGGIAALCGALCYAELAAAFPRSGGEYNYLSRALHPAAGFLAGWVSATVGFAAPIALAAMAFGKYFEGAVPGAPALPLALAVTWLVALVHLRGVSHSALLQNVSTWLKIGLIVLFILAGFLLGTPQPVSFLPLPGDGALIASAPFAVSLVYVMYSYSGWNAATYVASEVDDPERTLPWALVIATLTVLTLYVALNAVFLYTTPMAEMAGKVDVALVAGTHIFGEWGGRLVAALICIGLVSAISAMTWIGPRVTMVMGEDNPVLGPLSRKSATGVPANAILVQLAIVTLLLVTQSFERVLQFVQFTLTLSCFLTVLAVMVLRVREPELVRPYRTWGYPVTPLIFLAVTAYMMIYLLMERPFESLAGLATALSGLAIWALSQAISRAPSPALTSTGASDHA